MHGNLCYLSILCRHRDITNLIDTQVSDQPIAVYYIGDSLLYYTTGHGLKYIFYTPCIILL